MHFHSSSFRQGSPRLSLDILQHSFEIQHRQTEDQLHWDDPYTKVSIIHCFILTKSLVLLLSYTVILYFFFLIWPVTSSFRQDILNF